MARYPTCTFCGEPLSVDHTQWAPVMLGWALVHGSCADAMAVEVFAAVQAIEAQRGSRDG